MLLIAAGWITILLLGGGVALDNTLRALITRQFDEQLNYTLTAMIASAEIDPLGDVWFNRPLGDQRVLEPYSGLYWQVTGEGREPYYSRSLWDRSLMVSGRKAWNEPYYYDSSQFDDEPLRVVERSVTIPGSAVEWQFTVAAARSGLNEQIAAIRSILVWSFAVLGIGLLLMAMLQIWYGLGPLRRVRRAIARIRTSGANRVTDPLPQEVQPMVEELNALLAHSERQAEEARTHAGNLAHALKTPLTVLTNAASAAFRAARRTGLGRRVMSPFDLTPRAQAEQTIDELTDTYQGVRAVFDAEGRPMGGGPGGIVDNTDYGISGTPGNPAVNGGHTGNVIDSDPRIISNLVVDQTLKNPAAIMAALKYAGFEGTGAEFLAEVETIQALYQSYVAALEAVVEDVPGVRIHDGPGCRR